MKLPLFYVIVAWVFGCVAALEMVLKNPQNAIVYAILALTGAVTACAVKRK